MAALVLLWAFAGSPCAAAHPVGKGGLPLGALKRGLHGRLEQLGIRHVLNLSETSGGEPYVYLFVLSPTMPSRPVEAYLSGMVDDLKSTVLHRFRADLDFAPGSFFQFMHKPELETEDATEWVFSEFGNEVIEALVASWDRVRHLRVDKTGPSAARLTVIVAGEGLSETAAERRSAELMERIRGIAARSFPTLTLDGESWVHVVPTATVQETVAPPSREGASPVDVEASVREAFRRLFELAPTSPGLGRGGRAPSTARSGTAKQGSGKASAARASLAPLSVTALRKELDGRLRPVEDRLRRLDGLLAATAVDRVRIEKLQARYGELAALAQAMAARLEQAKPAKVPPAELHRAAMATTAKSTPPGRCGSTSLTTKRQPLVNDLEARIDALRRKHGYPERKRPSPVGRSSRRGRRLLFARRSGVADSPRLPPLASSAERVQGGAQLPSSGSDPASDPLSCSGGEVASATADAEETARLLRLRRAIESL